jgi:hypothetical protein
VLSVYSLLIVALALLACGVALPERRARPIPRWRVAVAPLLVAAAALILLWLPPHNDLREPEVWLMGLPFAAVGVGRGAFIGLQVDHRQGTLALQRAADGFWLCVAAAILVLADVVAEPFGRVGSGYVQAVELALVIVACFLVGRNAALLVRSRDAPQHDL